MIEYNLGRIYALAGRPAEAVDHVKKAISLRADAAEWVAGDPDMTSIRNRVDTNL
jgi:hypothetical protein